MANSQSDNLSDKTSPRVYFMIAILAIVISSIIVFGSVFFYSLHIYDATSYLAKNVVLSNVGLARNVCQSFFFYICFLQFAYLAPMAAGTSVVICCLCWSHLKRRKATTGSDFFMSLSPAPLVALAVFLLNSHPQFMMPFDPDIWRTYYLPASRSKMVAPLLETVPYRGMRSAKLKEILGCPDDERTSTDASGYFRYSISESNKRWLYFYFDQHKKVVGSEIKDFTSLLFTD